MYVKNIIPGKPEEIILANVNRLAQDCLRGATSELFF